VGSITVWANVDVSAKRMNLARAIQTKKRDRLPLKAKAEVKVENE
jgi:hypothetical protein